jgi:hypothetical protein
VEKPLPFHKKGSKMEITEDAPLEGLGDVTCTIRKGSEITRIYTFAGKGSKKELRVANRLSSKFGGNADRLESFTWTWRSKS